jgi:hypothetical protein
LISSKPVSGQPVSSDLSPDTSAFAGINPRDVQIISGLPVSPDDTDKVDD